MAIRTSVVILAAGLGTRMKSKKAKVLHCAGGACLLEHVIRAAEAVTGPDGIIAVVGHQAEQVQTAVAHHGIRFQLQEEQRGTGHALLTCADQPGVSEGRVVVLYGDGPLISPATLKRLCDSHAKSGSAATLITTMLPDPTGYGRIVKDEQGNVAAIVEEKAATADQKKVKEINAGLYCFEAAPLWEHLRRLKPNAASGEIYLTDLIESFRAAGLVSSPMPVEDAQELLGINTRVELAEVDRIFRERKTRALMLDGVTIERPETVVIDVDVQVGPDTVIGPFVQLLGQTKVGEDCRIGAGSILEDMQVGDGATLFPYCCLQQSAVGDGAQAGPFARMRPGAVMEPNSHVGNFVELKNTRLGTGSKAMHLAYLGDATIGAKVNVGAGTIICNYDGTKKHPTRIESGVFVGSNSTLVAPIDIGEGSYVAAGSVITDSVPQDALAIGRGRQVIKEGWAKRRRDERVKGSGS